ncbi:MAG: hypothetical protein WA672_13865 [Candidatus Angelobacter sp.]
MSVKIINVNQVNNGIVVNFEDGVCALFDSDFLYAQSDKRVQSDSDESSRQMQ